MVGNIQKNMIEHHNIIPLHFLLYSQLYTILFCFVLFVGWGMMSCYVAQFAIKHLSSSNSSAQQSTVLRLQMHPDSYNHLLKYCSA
jgi:hypothetical protein